jgi:hypothetical protein
VKLLDFEEVIIKIQTHDNYDEITKKWYNFVKVSHLEKMHIHSIVFVSTSQTDDLIRRVAHFFVHWGDNEILAKICEVSTILLRFADAH